jgi:hypothetical protein
MNNKKLFEEAIAEAKSIREAAIANAKEALEESLTPQIKELLAQRLTEMEDEKLPVMEEEEEEGAEEAGEEKEAGEEAEEDMDIEDMSVEELKDLIRDIVGQMVDQDGDGDHDMEDHELEGPEMPDMGMEEPAGEEAPEDKEEIDLEELLAELSYEEEEEPVMEDTIQEGGMETVDAVLNILKSLPDPADLPWYKVVPLFVGGAGAVVGAAASIEPFLKMLRSKFGAKGEQLASTLEKTGTATGASVKSGQSKGTFEAVNSELNEAKKTIKKLTESLQEVNLLNAKLLYVNKVLKENKHLSDSQVANVIATFDKATTAKEAKLVYESFTTSLVKKSNAPVVESKLKGFASKSTGKAPVKKVEVITEVSDAVKRMQKLAGIIKN